MNDSTTASLTAGLPVLSLAQIEAAAPALLATRNTKGRPLPIHMQGAPGVGKTMMATIIAKRQALIHPGIPYGVAIQNLAIASPTDIPGVMLFESSHHGERSIPERGDNALASTRATYTTPVVFRVSAIYYAPPGAESLDDVLTLPAVNAHGAPAYFGDHINLPAQPDGTATRVRLTHGLILLDEFMQAESDTRAAAAPLLDEGRAGIHTLPPNVAVWAISNRAKDASGVKKALAFLTNRACQVEVIPSQSALLAYFDGRRAPDALAPIMPMFDSYCESESGFKRRPMHPALVAFAESNMGRMVEAMVPATPGDPFLTPRSFEMASNVIDSLLRMKNGEIMSEDHPNAPDDYRLRRSIAMALVGGLIGAPEAAGLFGFIELFGQLPSVQEILANPQVPFSDRSDAQLLLAYRISDAMTVKNAAPLAAFLKRMDDTYAMLAVSRAVTNPKGNGNALTSVPAIKALFAGRESDLARLLMLAPREPKGAGKGK